MDKKREAIKLVKNSDSYMIIGDAGFCVKGSIGTPSMYSAMVIAEAKKRVPHELHNLFDQCVKMALENYELEADEIAKKVTEIGKEEAEKVKKEFFKDLEKETKK